MKIKSIKRNVELCPTWDITTESGEFSLPNGVVSHNSSLVINSTNGIEMPMELISTKESKAGNFVQVVPEYKKLKNKYQLMWEQPDCLDYLKTAAVLAAYVDQSISVNTFYNPSNYIDGKIPATIVAYNIMEYFRLGGKTLYYSLIQKQGAKTKLENKEVCESCVL